MHRRAAPPTLTILLPDVRVGYSAVRVLLVLAIMVLAVLPGPAVRVEAGADDATPTTTINEFFPESDNVTDCLGALERPGCGNENRGGWRQSLLFFVMVGGLVVVFGRIAYSVTRNRRAGP